MTNTKKKLLHQIPKGSKIRYGTLMNGQEIILTFKHLDGMYSYCEANTGETAHLSASTPLVKGKDGVYEIEEV